MGMSEISQWELLKILLNTNFDIVKLSGARYQLRIYAGFSVEGWSKCSGVRFLRVEDLQLGKALKFGVIFQKYALTLIQILKIIEKIREQM